jgi:hypothetical protein
VLRAVLILLCCVLSHAGPLQLWLHEKILSFKDRVLLASLILLCCVLSHAGPVPMWLHECFPKLEELDLSFNRVGGGSGWQLLLNTNHLVGCTRRQMPGGKLFCSCLKHGKMFCAVQRSSSQRSAALLLRHAAAVIAAVLLLLLLLGCQRLSALLQLTDTLPKYLADTPCLPLPPLCCITAYSVLMLVPSCTASAVDGHAAGVPCGHAVLAPASPPLNSGLKCADAAVFLRLCSWLPGCQHTLRTCRCWPVPPLR